MRLEGRFGAKVRALRGERNLTQEELAQRSEISVDSIRRIERGELSPSLSTLIKLAEGLDLRLRTLFSGLDNETRQPTPLVDQICDFLHHLSPNEVVRARRVLRAMLPTPAERDEPEPSGS